MGEQLTEGHERMRLPSLPHLSTTICRTKRTPRSSQTKDAFPIVQQHSVERSVLLVRHRQRRLPNRSTTLCRTKRTPRSSQTKTPSQSFNNTLLNEAYSSFVTDKDAFPIVQQHSVERSVLLVRHRQRRLSNRSTTLCRTKRTPRSSQTKTPSQSFNNTL